MREDGFFRHQEIVRAHADAVMAISMAGDCIYTASRDKILKRWKVGKNPATNRFELHNDIDVVLGETCWCLLHVGEWIFCGLGDGTIKGYSKTGQDCTLRGHTKRVNCLLIHQSILVSGSSDNTVRCWQPDPATQTFTCTNTVSEGIPGAVQCIAVLGATIWIGGTSGIGILDLTSLTVAVQPPPKKFLAGFLEFQGHMIAAYADGSLCIFDASGAPKHSQTPLAPGPILCLAGLESGPRVLCGHAKGQVSSIELPMFKPKTYWQAMERCKVQKLVCAGHDGIFLIGAENGNLQLWQRDSIVDQ